MDTPEAARRLATALGCDPRQVSWAGLKDRNAVTTQWMSLFRADPGAARALALPDLQILEVGRHPHKLRTGHLRSNRFSIRVDCDPTGLRMVEEIVQSLTAHGLPNYYGEQRFGRDNVGQARRWLLQGGRAPRARFTRKLLVSTLQSAVFNDWLAERMTAGLLDRALHGDVMRKEDSGGLFVTTDAAEESRRMAAWEISPTGPMFGARMPAAAGEAAERERSVFERWGLGALDLAALRKLAPGARRAARVRPAQLSVHALPDGLRLQFQLPPGAYATALLREVLKPGDTSSA